MENPILVEVLRGEFVESAHRGSIAIVDADGAVRASVGDVERPVFPRSAIKPLQALYLCESGAVDAFSLSPTDIALACSSHNGEDMHTDGVTSFLSKAGLTKTCLECGAQWPSHQPSRGPIIKEGRKPEAIHNNCSGKHAGFICASHHLGEEVAGYIQPEHPAQRDLKAILESLCDVEITRSEHMAADGCSIPTYALPLTSLAFGFAKFAAATSMGAKRDRAARDIHAACTSHPELVAGTGRFDTKIMAAYGASVLVKTGAEGVYAGMIPALGLGIALKCEDGGTRASEAMMAACLAATLDERPDILQHYLNAPLKNRNGWEVGHIRVAEGVVKALRP